MNKIFKVVWSKSKQCYVVVSEIAKNTTGKKKIIVASIFAVLSLQTSHVMAEPAPVPAGGDQPSIVINKGGQSTGALTNGISMAPGALIYTKQSIAIGYRSQATGFVNGNTIQPAVALGAGADANGAGAVSIGFIPEAHGDNAISIGSNTKANATGAIGLGKDVTASGSDSVSLGTSANASGSNSVSLGISANATDSGSIAIGQISESTDTNSVALGYKSKAKGASATAIGPQTEATKTSAVALGRGATATEDYAVAIGDSASATITNGVALGYKSKTTTASGVSGYDANANRTNKYAGLAGNALTSTWGAVSIGDGTNTRQMTGLAAGTNDTDAVNVAQLKSVNLAFTGDNSSSGDVNLANSKLAVTGDTTYITTTAAGQGIAIKGVKKDITVSNGTAAASVGMADAKNVAEAINQANADQKINYKANGGTANSVKLSDGLNFSNGTSTVATVGTNGQVTYDLNATTKKSIDDSEAAVKRTISLGADSGTRSSQSLNNNNVEFNVKGGTGSYITTAMNGNVVTINTTKGTIQSDTAGTASVSGADGLATAQNVATAINKAKEGSAWNLAVNTGAAQKVSGGTKVTLQNGNNIALTQSGTTITVGTTSQLTADSVTVGTGTNQIVLNGTTGEVSGKSIKTGNSTLNTNGLTISGGPSVTSTGINAGNKVVSGVSQGVAGTDAVNKSQMDAAVKAVADSTSDLGKNTITLAAQSGSTTGQALSSASGIKFNINGESGSDALISTSASGTNVSVASTQKLKDAVAQAANAANKDLSNLSTAGDTHIKDLAKTAATWNVSTNGSNTTAVAGGETVNLVNGDNVAITNTGRNITIGTAKTVSFDKVTVGGITIDKTDGINAGGKEIKGIADATAADSAVSKGQMDTAIANAQTAATSTEKVVAKTLTGDNNLATVTGQTGTAKNETYEVAVSENAVKAVAVNAAQDAVNVAGTGLATVSDATTGGVKTYTVNVEEGKLVLDDTTGNVGAAGSTQGTTAGKDGVATTQNVAKAINEAVTKANANNAQALADAEHKFDGDTGTTSVRKHGEVLSIKGGVTTPTDLTTGNIGVVSDGAGTLNVRLAKTLTGLTSATYTDGAGNTQTVTGASSTITDGAGNTTTLTKGGLSTTDGTNTTTVAPTGVTATDGTHTVKVEGTGINTGGTEIKGIADATAADSAVSKGQMDIAIANAQTAATSTEKVVAKTLTGDNNLATVTGQTGTAKNETYEVAVSENAVKAVAVNAAQDAVNVAGTGLATVSDATTGGVKTYTVNVEEGKLVLDDTTGNVGAAGSTQGTTAGKDGVATTQNVAKAINEAVTKANANNAQALADAEHKFDGDTGTTSVRKHGEVLSIKGGVTTPTDLTTGNIGVVSDGAGTLNVRLAKVLTGLTSATYTDAAGNTTTVTGGSTTIADAAGNTQTLAPTKSEIKDAAGVSTVTTKDGVTAKDAAGNTTALTKGGLSTTDGTNTTTVAPTGVTVTAGTHTVKVEGSGIDAGNTEIKNVAAGTTATSAVNKQQMEDAVKAGGTWKVKTNTGATTEVTGGDTVDFINGDNIAITNTGRNITIGTAKTVSFDKVTVGGITIDKTDGINAGGKEIKGIADATAADSAVSKGQMDTAIANAQTAATSTEKVVAKTLTGDNNLATVTGQTGTAKNETYEVAVSENAVKAVAVNAAQDAVNVAGTGLATVSDATTGGVKTYTVNVEEGKLVLDDTTGNVGAAGSTQGTTAGKDGVATTQNVAKAINEAVTKANANNAQALADAEHKFDGDTGTTSVRKHGEVLSVKGGVTTPADLTTGNIGVVSDGAGTLNVRLAKALTGLTSATYTDGAGNTQTVTGASSTITDGAGNTTSMTKGGLSTTDGTNTTTVAPTGVIATDGTHTVKVEGAGIDAGNTEIKNVAAGTTATSAVNKKQMEDAVKAGGTWKVTTNTGTTTEVTGGDTVDFINGDNIAITNTGRNITIGTAKNVSFDKVTVGGITIDKTDGINAGGKEIKGIADATAADSAVSKGQMDTAIANAQTAATSTEKVVAKTLTGDNNLATVTGQTGTAKNETYEVAVSENAVKAVAVNAAQDAVNVAGTGLATVSDATTGGVKTYTVNVEEGKLVLDDTTGNVGAAGSTQGTTAGKDGVATTQNVAKAINEAVTKANANNAQALADAEHKFDGDTGTTSVRKHGEVLSIKGGVTTPADLTTGNIGVVSDGAGTLNVRLAKTLTGLTSATYTDAAGNTTTVTGGTTTIADAAGNTQTLAPTKSEIKDAAGVSTVTTKDGVTATDAAGNTTALTNGGVSTTDGAGNTTALTKGGLSTTDGTNTTTVTPNGMTATDGTNTVKVEGSGIDAGNTEIKNVAAGTTNTSAVNKKQMDDAINKATGDATHEFGGDDTTVVSRKHGEQLNIKGGASTAAADLTDGNIAVLGDATTGTLNLKLAKVLTGLTSATYTDAAGNTTTVTGGTTTIADAAGNTQTLAPTKSEIKDAAGVSTVTTKDGVTATDAAGNTTALTNGGVSTTDGAGNTTELTKGGLSTTDGTNTTTVTPNGMTATDGTNTVKVNGSGIDAGNTEIKNVAAGTTNTSAVNKKQMDDAISKATGDATHEFGGDDTTVVSRKHGEQLNIKGGASTAAADLTDGNIAVLGDATTGTLNLKLAKVLTGLTSATYTDAAGNTTTVTGGTTTIADAAGNTQTLAPTKSEIKDAAGISTVTTKDGVTAKDAAGNTTALTNGGVSTTDGAGNTTALTKGGLSTTDGTNTTTVTPNGMTATDGTNTVKVEGSGIDAGNTEIKNVAAGTTNTSAVNKKQMDDAINKATGDATHEFGGDDTTVVSRKHGEQLNIKGGASTAAADLTDGNIAVLGDATTGTLNLKLAKVLTGLTSATYTDAAGNTTTVTGGTTTIADAAGNTQTLAPTKSEIKDAAGVSTVTTKDGVTATDAAGNTTALTNGGVSTTDGVGNTTALTKGGLSTTDGTNTTTVTPNGLTATDGTNTVKVNGSGIDAGNTEIKNVADGTTPHSAVNKNQLDTAVNRLQNATDNISLNIAGNNGTGNVKLKDQVLHIDGTNGLTTKANGQSLTVGLDDATMSTINNTAALANNAAKKDLSNIDQAGKEVIKDTAAWHVKVNSKAPELVKGGDTVTFNDGHNITITNTGKDITVATKKEVTFDKVSVGGITIDKQADHISGVSSITGSGSGAPTMTFNAPNGSTPANVSMNSNLDMGGKQINNVAAATRPTDAVNKQQVDQAMKSLAGMADSAAKKYASKAGANAAALAALKPIQYDPLAPTQIMAGIGNYKSQTAVALGVAHYTNEDTMFNIGASLDSQDAMLNAGVTHKFGSSTERKNIPDRYKGGPISSIYVMQDEVSALKAQNSEMQAMLDKQSSENAAIIAENKMLREQNEEMQRKVDLILSKLQ